LLHDVSQLDLDPAAAEDRRGVLRAAAHHPSTVDANAALHHLVAVLLDGPAVISIMSVGTISRLQGQA